MAEHYGTLEGALQYHTDRGNSVWVDAAADPANDDELTSSLVRASQYIDGHYAGQWPGTRTGGRSQVLAWPRTDAHDTEGNPIPADEVPREVEYATYEAALREFQNPGGLTPDFVQGQRITRERVDVIEVEYSDATSVSDAIPVLTLIDEILAPILGVDFDSSTTIAFLLRA